MISSLEDWRKQKGWTRARLRDELKASSSSRVREWCLGMSMPRDPCTIDRIAEVTGGEVTLEVLYNAAAKRRGRGKVHRMIAAAE